MRVVAALWIAVALAFVALMGGSVFGWKRVATDEWGRLPLSIFVFLATVLSGFRWRCCWRKPSVAPLRATRGVHRCDRDRPRDAHPDDLFCAAIVIR
jgi:hypothetical protein